MTGARFPPPRGRAGYREAEQPADVPQPTGDEDHRGIRRVVAMRPDDPDVAMAKAAHAPKSQHDLARKRRRATFVAIMIWFLIVGAIVLGSIITSKPKPPPTRQLPR